ncbi:MULTISPECIES: tetratricopeptide repeat protein [Parabacteroides]|uniref:transcriptional regulator n=1 Tax=Parabacteroides TaxID=375288 RepID=UPI001F3324A1|nr:MULTISPECIES: tetratricopeptide repeat protein [Parabacteroides]
MDLSRDTTLILKSLVYYKKHGNASQKGWSNYYAGRVYEEAGKLFEAGLYFLKAAEYAGEIPDPLLGMMANYYLGELHDKQYAFDKSLEAYKKSYAIYDQTSGEKYTGTLLHSIGSEYGINGNRDSAYFYLEKALDIAREQKDTIEMAAIYNDIGVYLKEDSLYLKSKCYLQQSLSLDSDSSWMITRKITLAEIHAYLNETDSAFFLLDGMKSVVEELDDIELRAIYYSALAKTEAASKNYESASFYQNRYVACVDSVYQLQRKGSLAEIEQIYNYLKYQEENEKLHTVQDGAIVVGWIILSLLLVVFLLIGGMKWKKKQDLSKAEDTVDVLRKMEKVNKSNCNNDAGKKVALSGYSDDEKGMMVKKALLMQLNITKVLSQLDEKSEKEQSFLKKFNSLFYGEQHTLEIDWSELYLLIDLLYNDFASKLRKHYGKILLEKEIQLCCLLKTNMDTTEIACVMKQSINTVRTRKTCIRKKLKAPDGADIIIILEEGVNNKG